MNNLGELKSKRAKMLVDAKATIEIAGKEVRGLTDEESSRISDLEKQIDSMTATIDKMEKMEERNAQFNKPVAQALGSEDTSLSDMADKDLSKYSMLRAIRRTMENKPLDGVEGEVNQELARRHGRKSAGFWIPSSRLGATAGTVVSGQRDTLNTTSGTGAVFTTPQGFIDLLRAQTVLTAAGATYLTNMNGKFAIPRLSGAATASWVTEGNAPSASNETIGQVAFAPKTLGSYVDITRQFALQTATDAESLVRNDLAQIMARGIESAAFYGTGANGQPKGLTQLDTPITAESVSTTPTWANIVDTETDVLSANVQSGKFAYITNPKVRGLYKKTLKTPTYGSDRFVDSDGSMNSYPLLTSSLIVYQTGSGISGTGTFPCFFGAWDQLVIAMWNSSEILVDPYTGSSSGTVRIVALQEADINFRHQEAFAVLNKNAT